MDKRIIVTVVCSTLGLINASGFALAETVGRLECSVVGAVSPDPIGDKDGHLLRSNQYSCLGMEGLLKGAVYSGSSTSEWDGSQGTYLSGGGIIRVAGGLAVTQITEGTGSIVMKDGKPAVHAHAIVGKKDGSAHGGHLLKAHVRPTCEVILTESPAHLEKAIDPESGIALIRP